MYVIVYTWGKERFIDRSDVIMEYEEAFDRLMQLRTEDDSEGECSYNIMQLMPCG